MPKYSGTPLKWTPLGPKFLSYIARCPSYNHGQSGWSKTMDHETDCIDKRPVLSIFSSYTRIKDMSGLIALTVGCWYLRIFVVGVVNCPLCEVIRYWAGSNGTKVSVQNSRVSADEGVWMYLNLSMNASFCALMMCHPVATHNHRVGRPL